jgi:hypothetical protein
MAIRERVGPEGWYCLKIENTSDELSDELSMEYLVVGYDNA